MSSPSVLLGGKKWIPCALTVAERRSDWRCFEMRLLAQDRRPKRAGDVQQDRKRLLLALLFVSPFVSSCTQYTRRKKKRDVEDEIIARVKRVVKVGRKRGGSGRAKGNRGREDTAQQLWNAVYCIQNERRSNQRRQSRPWRPGTA